VSPFFSICIPAYNASRFLSATIESILSQSFRDFEIVIVNNGSTDNTAMLISTFLDDRIRVVTNLETVPAHENWTRTIGLAKGDWLKIVCADDLLRPNALQVIHDDLMGHPEVSIHAGIRDVIDESGILVKSAKAQFSNGALLELVDLVNGILNTGTNPLGEPLCLTWSSSLSGQVGSFSGNWKYFIDLDYWLRLSKRSPIFYSSEVVGSFRVSRGSWTSSIGFRTINEAQRFFFSRDEFKSCSIHVKYRAVAKAGLRTIARQLFLLIVLRRRSWESQSK
jgi:glycosyltransferase involved in cell wall biosynthesis